MEHRDFLAVIVVALIIVTIGMTFGSDMIQSVGQQRTTTATATVIYYTGFTITESVISGGNLTILDVCYSPGGNCAAVIQKYWDAATKSIYVAIYSFTLNNLADSLVKAKVRGVIVQAVFDKTQMAVQGSQYLYLKQSGVEVKIDRAVDMLHDKFSIIDGTIVITGSFNLSSHANLDNRENLLVIDSVDVAKTYYDQFVIIWNESGD